MAAKGRGRGRGLLAATIQPQVPLGAGDCSDRRATDLLQDDIKSSTSSKPKQFMTSSSTTVTSSSTTSSNTFHLSSLSTPRSTSSLLAQKGFSSLSQRTLSSSSSGQRSSSPQAQRSSAVSGLTTTENSSPSTAQRSSSQSGSTTSKTSCVAVALEAPLNNLCTYGDDADVCEVAELMKELMVSAGDLKDATELLYEKCVSDLNVAKSGALICNSLASVEVDGSKFRSSILRCLQKDFENKDKLHSEGSSRFLGFFSFLCQVFAEMRTSTGEHFLPLITPILTCVELILGVKDGELVTDYKDNADEIECILLQFQSIGKDLETCDEEKMMKTMETVRAKIINNGTSPRVRCTLLELIESYGRRFEQAPNQVTCFYCETMAEILAGLAV